MPRQTGTVVENNFIKGLITETTGLRFPTDACTETWNCVFDETGRITRRLGIDIETDQTSVTLSISNEEATSSYLWSYVGSYTDGSFLVQQIGNIIYFYDVSNSTQITGNKKSFSINLADFQSKPSISPSSHVCQYVQGAGRLVIVNEASTPILVNYSFVDDAITTQAVTLKYRDFQGAPSSLRVDERPSSTAAALATSNPQHLYNILNQGWGVLGGATSALAQWDTARGDMPSTADAPVYYRALNEQTIFDNTLVTGTNPGNSPAPKGHFILELGLNSREEAALLEGYTIDLGEEGTSSITAISQAAGSVIASASVTNTSNAFDSNSSTVAEASATSNHFLGKDFGVDSYIPGAVDISVRANFITTSNTYRLALYGSNTLPTNSTNGTLLGTTTFTVAQGTNYTTRRLISSNVSTAYRYVWVDFDLFDSGGFAGYRLHEISELTFFSYNEASESDRGAGPSTVAFFASRAFYAGLNDAELGSNIFFSQLIESDDQFSNCFQVNDPTSIEIADLLATDGGVIKIPDIGKIYRLFTFQNQLLVLAANGVWSVAGPSNGAFSATGYIVSRLSSIGMSSPLSVVDVKGLPVWWGEDGIYTVKYDANYGSTVVQSITEESIKQFILDIPEEKRKYVKGAYDRFQDIAYWIYSDDTLNNNYSYNKVLCLNTKTSAFYPWEISVSSANPQYVKDILYVQDGLRSADPAIKLLTYNGTKYFFSDFRNTNYLDWTTYSEIITFNDADEEDYTSYFISGYRVDGEGLLYVQTPYVYWYLEPEAESYAETQALFDWTTSASSNKWSTVQVIECRPIGYNQYREVKPYRRKYRGKGRAIQMKVSSGTGKPFTLIGWGLVASASASV